MSSSSVQLHPQLVQQYVPFPGFSPIEYMSPPIASDKDTLPDGCDSGACFVPEAVALRGRPIGRIRPQLPYRCPSCAAAYGGGGQAGTSRRRVRSARPVGLRCADRGGV